MKRSNFRTKSNISLHFFFCSGTFSKEKWKLKASSFSENCVGERKQALGVCLFTLLWSHGSTVGRRLIPISAEYRWLSTPGLHVTHWLRWILWLCCISNLAPVLISLSLTDTCVQINQSFILSGMHTGPYRERESTYLWAVGSALAKLSVRRGKLFSYVAYCITKNNIFSTSSCAAHPFSGFMEFL